MDDDICPKCKQLGIYRAKGMYLCDNQKCRVVIFK
jgi:hypothetical protein